MTALRLPLAAALAAALTAGPRARAAGFSHDPPGALAPGSGKGRADTKVYAAAMRFPIESAPAYANSQVWGHGGMNGPGAACDLENFSYPWRDNFCETREWDMPLCPGGQGHQGQDIRAATCRNAEHWAVAAADGVITSIGSYSVYLTAPGGTRFEYLHMADLQVKEGARVARGDRIGKVSNVFGGTPTTVHLHFNIRQNVEGYGSVYVPPYTSLVAAYDALIAPPAEPPPPPRDAPPASQAPLPVAAAPIGEAPRDPDDAPDGAASEGGAGGCATARAPVGGGACAAFVLGVVGALRRRRRGQRLIRDPNQGKRGLSRLPSLDPRSPRAS